MTCDSPRILDQISQVWPPPRWLDCRVIVGCSGGADSVALAVALAKLRQNAVDCSSTPNRTTGSLTLLHVNHGLRGNESDGDETFASELAQRLGMGFQSFRLAGDVADEAALRSRREAIFAEFAHASGSRYVAVGHTADDNTETVLHHLFRGTGPAGLAGIAPFRPLGAEAVLVRPLLAIRRHELREWLRSAEIPWREDSSNEDTRYTRNWIRHELLPAVEAKYPGASGRIAATIAIQRDWRSVIERLAHQWLEEHQVSFDHTHCTTLRRGAGADPTVVIEALQQIWRRMLWPRSAMAAGHWQRVAESILSQEFHRYTLPGRVQVDASEAKVTLCRLGGVKHE